MPEGIYLDVLNAASASSGSIPIKRVIRSTMVPSTPVWNETKSIMGIGARYGIPSVWISAGEDEVSGAQNYTEFWGKDYHTVKDEFDPEWELAGMKQTIKFALLLIDQINQMESAPQMKSDVSFPV